MVPKRRRPPLDIYRGEPGVDDIHVRYANLDFRQKGMPAGALPVLNWCYDKMDEMKGVDWNRSRIFQFLKKHHNIFCHSLEWISTGLPANYGDFYDDDEEVGSQYGWWSEEPAVHFLQLHGIEHGRLSLGPVNEDKPFFRGFELEQSSYQDPLDPLCWLLLNHYYKPVKRCLNPKCSKFFFQLTRRKLFCSDSCRAQRSVVKRLHAPGGRDSFRTLKAEYMRNYRRLPPVKKRR